MSISAAVETGSLQGQERSLNQFAQDLIQNEAADHIRSCSYQQTETSLSVHGEGDREVSAPSSSRLEALKSTMRCAMTFPFNSVTASDGIVSTPPDGIVAGGTVSATKQLPPDTTAGNRSVRRSHGGENCGVHSWIRSMEAASRMFPLQFSISDSILVKCSSQIQSPAPTFRCIVRKNGSIFNTNPVAYHDHSAVSMAAAESTISCGGVKSRFVPSVQK